MRTDQLCNACEAPHATADVCPVDPIASLARETELLKLDLAHMDRRDQHHLGEIRRLDRELATARAKVHALEQRLEGVEAKLRVTERERDAYEASASKLRAEMLKAAPEAEA